MDATELLRVLDRRVALAGRVEGKTDQPTPREGTHACTHTRRRRAVLDRPLQLGHRQGEGVSTDSCSAGRPRSPPEFGGYFTFLKDGKHVGGCMANDGTGVSGRLDRLPDDGRRRPHGRGSGRERRPVDLAPMDVAENGRMAMVVDPGGAAIGVWQPGNMKGFDAERGRRGLLVRAAHARLRQECAFYRDVFGWDAHAMSDAPEFRYTTLGEGDGALAGIYDATEDIPRASLAPGRCTSRSRTSTPRSSGSPSSAARSSGRPRTRRTAGWQRPPTRPAAGSSWSRARADCSGGRPRARPPRIDSRYFLGQFHLT